MPRFAQILGLALAALLALAATLVGVWYLARVLNMALLLWWGDQLWATLATGLLLTLPALITLVVLVRKPRRRARPTPENVALSLAKEHPWAAVTLALGAGLIASHSPTLEAMIVSWLKDQAPKA